MMMYDDVQYHERPNVVTKAHAKRQIVERKGYKKT